MEKVGRGLLFWAAEYGHCQIIRVLLEMGVPVDSRNDHGSTSLHIAIRFNQTLSIQTLLAASAQVNVSTSEWVDDRASGRPVKPSTAETPFQLWFRFTPLELPILRSLISAGENPNQYINAGQNTLLHWLSLHSPEEFSSHYEQMMKYLVSDGHARIDAPTEVEGRTPLELAILSRNYRAMRILLAAEANPNCRETPGWNIQYACPLYLAVQRGDIYSVKLLLRANADPDGSGSFRPLVLAVQGRLYGIVEALLSAGANPSVKVQYTGVTALHAAVSSFASSGRDIMQALLEAGADIESRTGFGETPLHLAAAELNVDALRLLLLSGAQVNSLSILDRTPIFYLFGWFCHRIHDLSQKLETAVNILVRAGTDVTIKDKHGETVLDKVPIYSNVKQDHRSDVFSSCFRILFNAWEKALSSGGEVSWDWETVSIEVLKERYRIMKRQFDN